MSEIICTQAWTCGDKDCTAQWHVRNFWAYGDGTYSVDEYSDGDHEGCDIEDIPSPEEISASWREYAQHVAETGEDPLSNYYVRRHQTKQQSWSFCFGNSIVGPVLLRALHGRRRVLGLDLPFHIREFLNLHRDGRRLLDFATWEDFTAGAPDIKPGKWVHYKIDYRQPRNPETIVRELRNAARRHLRQVAA